MDRVGGQRCHLRPQDSGGLYGGSLPPWVLPGDAADLCRADGSGFDRQYAGQSDQFVQVLRHALRPGGGTWPPRARGARGGRRLDRVDSRDAHTPSWRDEAWPAPLHSSGVWGRGCPYWQRCHGCLSTSGRCSGLTRRLSREVCCTFDEGRNDDASNGTNLGQYFSGKESQVLRRECIR